MNIEKSKWSLLLAFTLCCLALSASSCGYQPDTSAPERAEIERGSDWRGALLYIADSGGPTPEWGSIRIYDNVSGFVEKTVEQDRAAEPTDMYVTAEGSSMYVASGANGLIDEFRWDGNNWIPGDSDIETPSSRLLALKEGPDKKIYAVDGSPDISVARLFVIDPYNPKLSPATIDLPPLSQGSGVSWSSDGSRIYFVGQDPAQTSLIVLAAWPSMQTIKTVKLPMPSLHQVETSPDGRFVYVMGMGSVIQMDASDGTLIGSLNPAEENDVDYTDADFSADGRFMFLLGTPTGSHSNLYIIDLDTGGLVNMVNSVSTSALGIQRTE